MIKRLRRRVVTTLLAYSDEAESAAGSGLCRGREGEAWARAHRD